MMSAMHRILWEECLLLNELSMCHQVETLPESQSNQQWSLSHFSVSQLRHASHPFPALLDMKWAFAHRILPKGTSPFHFSNDEAVLGEVSNSLHQSANGCPTYSPFHDTVCKIWNAWWKLENPTTQILLIHLPDFWSYIRVLIIMCGINKCLMWVFSWGVELEGFPV